MSSRQSVQNVSSSVPVLGEQFQNRLDLIGPQRGADEAAAPPVTKRQKIIRFLRAIDNGNFETVLQAIDEGADVNAKSCDKTALMEAVISGRTKIVKLLLQKGADPNLEDECTRETALMFAVYQGLTDIVKLLIEAGARVQQRDVDTVNQSIEEVLELLESPERRIDKKLVQNLPTIKTLLEERLEEQKRLLRSAGRKVIKEHGLLPGELGNRISEYIASEYH